MNGVKAPRRGSAGLIVILGPEIPRVGGETETAWCIWVILCVFFRLCVLVSLWGVLLRVISSQLRRAVQSEAYSYAGFNYALHAVACFGKDSGIA